MAMIPIPPVQVRVRCEWITGRPKSVRLAAGTVPVLAVRRVRSEAAAHPVEADPRTLFEVDTPDGRLALIYEHRRRRWILDACEGSDDVAPSDVVAARPPADVLRLPWAA